MPWKCPDCGTETIADAENRCPNCPYVRFPAGIVLVSDATGKEAQTRLPFTFGKATLDRLGDADVKYVSNEQFKLEKHTEQGGWAVVNVSWATNPTFLNGAAIPSEGVILKNGDKLSVKDKYFRLTVRVLT